MSLGTDLALKAIRLYQIVLSPWVGRQCRFVPTCSSYAAEAIERFGLLRGGYMTAARLLRCHPFGGSGFDPVPERFSWRCWRHEAGPQDARSINSNK